MVSSCCAYGCTERQKKGGDLSFHKFPSDIELRKKWINATKRKGFLPTESSKLCSKHFEPTDFVRNFGRLSLSKTAVPSVFDFSNRKKERESGKKRIHRNFSVCKFSQKATCDKRTQGHFSIRKFSNELTTLPEKRVQGGYSVRKLSGEIATSVAQNVFENNDTITEHNRINNKAILNAVPCPDYSIKQENRDTVSIQHDTDTVKLEVIEEPEYKTPTEEKMQAMLFFETLIDDFLALPDDKQVTFKLEVLSLLRTLSNKTK